MMIVDAVAAAPTQHSVLFLATAYIESLRHFERTCGVPEGVLRLPLAGEGDLQARLDTLQRNTEVRLESVVAVSELAAVLACALERLRGLDQPGQATHDELPMPSARSDSRRSALSV